MELWQMRKQYRALAAAARRVPKTMPREVELLEAQLVALLLACDRLETEQGLIRLAQRSLRARLRRAQRWVELAAFMKSSRALLVPRALEDTIDGLARSVEARGLPAAALRQALDELTSLDRRWDELRARLDRATVVVDQQLRQLASWVRVFREPGSVEGA